MPGGAAHQSASRPSSWWLSRYITNVFLSRMNQAGEPWLRRSVVSGRARHSSRTRSSTDLTLSRHKRVLIRSGRRPRFRGVPQEPLRGVEFLDTPPATDALAAVARRQHGLITTAQLAACGPGYAAVSRRV